MWRHVTMVAKFLDHNNRELKQRRRRAAFYQWQKKKKKQQQQPWNWMWLFSYSKFQVVFVHILDEFPWMMFSERKQLVTA